MAVAAHLKKGTWVSILSGDLVLCVREILNMMIDSRDVLKVVKRMNLEHNLAIETKGPRVLVDESGHPMTCLTSDQGDRSNAGWHFSGQVQLRSILSRSSQISAQNDLNHHSLMYLLSS